MILSANELKFLTDNVATPLVKAIATAHFGEPIGTGATTVAKWIGQKVQDGMSARDIERKLDGLADKVVRGILPLFEGSEEARRAIEPVSYQLRFPILGIADSGYLVDKNLDFEHISRDVQKRYKLPPKQHSDLETELYKNALDRIVRYLIEFAPLLPKFTQESVGKQLQLLSSLDGRFDQIVDDVRQLEEAISKVAAALPAGSSSDDQRFELEYRLSLIKKLDYLELFGADIAPEAQRQELSVAYITLNLASSLTSKTVEYGSIDTLLTHIAGRDRKRLLVRGEAGSGKSTLLRWVALTASRPGPRANDTRPFFALEESLEDDLLFRDSTTKVPTGATPLPALNLRDQHMEIQEANNWRNRVPFLVRMRDCQRHLPSIAQLVQLCNSAIDREPPGWAARVLRAGRGLVLFDGIDEVPNMNRVEIGNQIAAFVKGYPDNLFVISTRPAAVQAGWLAAEGFLEAHVNPLGERDRVELIDRWHKAVSRQIGLKTSVEPDLTNEAEKLKTEIGENPALNRLATNPLLCAMICALHHARSSVIPQSAADLCEALCHMLLERREAEAGIDLSQFPLAYRNLSYSQRKALVQELAHYMVRNESSSIDAATADSILGKTYKQFPNLPIPDPSLIRVTLVERTGVLREPAVGAIDFIHNTIKEYLAANQFIDDDDFGFLATRALDENWQSLLAFAASSPNRNAADKLIAAILDRTRGSSDIESIRKWRLLAMRCAASAVRISVEQKAEVDKISQSLFPPKNMSEAEALAFGGDFVVPRLQYNKRSPARTAAACVRTLRLIGTSKAREEIENYLNDSRWTVVSEAIQDMNPLRAPLVRRSITTPSDYRYYQYDIARRIEDIEPLRDVPGITVLRIPHSQVTDLSPIEGCATLKWLDLSYTPVTDWSTISTLASLESLRARATKLTDAALLSAPLPRTLESLVLDKTPIISLAPIANCKQLHQLSVLETRVETLSGVGNLKALNEISVGSPDLTSVEDVRGLTNLKTLTLDAPKLRDLSSLGSLQLERLNIHVSPEADLEPILSLSELEVLSISSSLCSAILGKAEWKNLEVVYLDMKNIDSLEVLERFPSLSAVTLQGLEVSDLTSLPILPKLRRFGLRGSRVRSLDGIERQKSLTELTLQGGQVDNLSALGECKGLRLVTVGPSQVDIIDYVRTLKGVSVRVAGNAYYEARLGIRVPSTG